MRPLKFFLPFVGRLLLLAVVFTVTACDTISPTRFSGDVDALVVRGEAYLARLVATPPAELTDSEVIALGYAERLRLGLGSPFRLIDYALRDPALTEDEREPLAYGLLSRTLDGRSYFVDSRVLESVALTGAPSARNAAYHQLQLIERTIETAPSASAGERIVRVGYLLASSERTVTDDNGSMASHVAAVIADRRRAQEDATRLLSTAARTGTDPLELLRHWRTQRVFQVEKPAMSPVTVADEEAEAREGPALALALRSLAHRQSSAQMMVRGAVRPPLPGQESLLNEEVALRLRHLAAERNYPAQAPISVAVRINRDGLLDQSRLSEAQIEARRSFVDEAVNEERLAAGAAVLSAQDATRGQRFPLLLLQSAAFMRGWNQEEPWFPGDPAPVERELTARFALNTISFDESVDPSWRPFYLRMLGRSLSDLNRVIPTVSFRGLSIHIGEIPSTGRALALHDPAKRMLYLPPASGAGTLAHELAHDLDWQLARKRYGTRGGYATDMAVRSTRGDRIASAMMELSASMVQPAGEQPLKAHDTRPAEVFARGADWLVAASLAQEGRTGGYLTSFQDPLMTGYGTTRNPDISGGAVPALISILDEIAPISAAKREWAVETYGPRRSLTTAEVAAAVAGAGEGLAPLYRLQKIRLVGEQSLQAVSDCRVAPTDGVRRLVAAQQGLAEASVSAAARGAAVDALRALAVAELGDGIRADADAWIAWRLYGAPQPAESVLTQLEPAFEDLLLQASTIQSRGREPAAKSTFRIGRDAKICGGNPFAADGPIGRFRVAATQGRM